MLIGLEVNIGRAPIIVKIKPSGKVSDIMNVFGFKS